MTNWFKLFTGGVFDTNCYLVETPQGNILFDAPQGADEAFAGTPIRLLLLTHGHFDHVADGAKIQRRHGCEVGCHADTVPMISDADFFRNFGFELEVEPFRPDFLIEESESVQFPGETARVLLVPGHCPGSLCFYLGSKKTVIGGDVLFAGGVGRWDLPGGDRDLLFSGIREKLFSLPGETTVLPGHGGPTTIEEEKRSNPYLRD